VDISCLTSRWIGGRLASEDDRIARLNIFTEERVRLTIEKSKTPSTPEIGHCLPTLLELILLTVGYRQWDYQRRSILSGLCESPHQLDEERVDILRSGYRCSRETGKIFTKKFLTRTVAKRSIRRVPNHEIKTSPCFRK